MRLIHETNWRQTFGIRVIIGKASFSVIDHFFVEIMQKSLLIVFGSCKTTGQRSVSELIETKD